MATAGVSAPSADAVPADTTVQPPETDAAVEKDATAGAEGLRPDDRYWTPRRVVWALAWLGIALRAWVTAAGWFYWDDYILQTRAWEQPFGADYLSYAHDGHLMPGALALQWPLTREFPMQFFPLVLVLIALHAVALLLFARLLNRQFADSYRVVAPMALLAFSPLTLPAGTWWSAAINALPLQIAMVLSLGAFLSWYRLGRRRSSWLAIGAWVAALAFFEKAVLIPVALLGLAVVLDVDRGPLRALGHTLRRHWLFWSVNVVLVAGYAVTYVTLAPRTATTGLDWQSSADFVSRGLSSTVVTGVTGGPWTWQPIGYGSALVEPPVFLLVLAVQLLVLVVAASCLVRRRAARAWIWLLGYALVSLAAVAAGRLVPGALATSAEGLRYVADVAVPFALALGLATTPLRGEPDTPAQARVDTALRRRPLLTAAVAVALVVAYALSSVVSSATFREIWNANPSRPYVENATESLAALDDDQPLLDQPVPDFVLYPLAYPYNQVPRLLAPVDPPVNFVPWVEDLRLVDATGEVVPAYVDGVTARKGPLKNCGWRAGPGSVYISLRQGVSLLSHTVRIGYLASSDAVIRVSFQNPGAPEYAIPVRKGLNTVYLTMAGGGYFLKVSAPTRSATVCVTDVAVGTMTALPDGADAEGLS